tara:strand:- start:437 stop:1201 length:765 start_codon:yes stop_codon:yes gene_type:complete
MIPPRLFGADFDNLFKLREKRISISVDSLELDPSADYRVFIQIEPPSVKNIIYPLVVNHEAFDLILAWHPEVLNKCPNSKKFILGTLWIDLEKYVSSKNNEICFFTSDKNYTAGHHLRHQVFNYLSSRPTINGFSIKNIMTPPRIENKNDIYSNSKFSIVIENESIPNWITEKLIDSLATRTVPLYWGSPNVGDYFDCKGIIQVTSFPDLIEKLNTVSPDFYESSTKSIEYNYEECLKYDDLFRRVDEELDLVV